MSRAQWGHGFWRGMEAGINAKGTLLGLFFHERVSGKIERQGKVLRQIEGGKYLVETYSWLDGSAAGGRIVSEDVMRYWDFYETNEGMIEAYAKENNWSQEDWDVQRMMTGQ